ncbi:MAG: right-handed parallel beta-helix repeat-containing protein [Verrucomicrobia bacterium]|nr:right-handed parallel beta-helix repeat-containing protein [Verrucomicrobiota bacterium]
MRVFGGRVSGWPTAGIVLTGSGTTVSEVTVTNSGAAIVLDQAGGTRISRCTAMDIAVIAAYTLCLSADSVEHCTLQNISGAGGLTAISAGVQVSNCVLQTLSGNGLVGISAVGQVLDCTLLSLTGTTITGIGASRVSRCQVSGAGSAATTTLVGISATSVSECLVSTLVQGGVGSGTSTAINALHCLNTAVLNAYFNGSGATPGLRIGMQAAGCTVSNVHNSGTGSAAGIAVNAFASSRGLVSQCRVDNCETGIVTGDGSQVLQCTVIGCDNTGIQVGQRCGVLDCTVSGNGLVSTSPGISTDIRTQVMRCNSNDNSGDGIAILGGCRVEGCTAENSTLGSGIRVVSGSGSRIEANHVRDNHRYGIEATAGDVIARNTAGGNVLGAYLPASGNNFAPVQLPATATNPAANF